MKFPITLIACALIFCLPLQIFGQKITRSKAHLVKTYTFYKNANPTLNHLNYFDVMDREMQLSTASKMVLTETVAGQNGYTHFKYQQFHEGLPIFGSRYILHEKEGRVITSTGHYSPQTHAVAKPGINAATAIAFAKRALNAREYVVKTPAPILCFLDPAFPNVSETLRLAYLVDLHSTEPFDKRRYFVDASTGKILTEFPLIIQQGVPSTAKTKYYGVQNIITDSLGPQQFVLRDPTRGMGIQVFNDNGSSFTNTSSHWDLANLQMDEVALDAHYCTQEYYDMMLADYNWQGQDGIGKALKAYVHAGDFVNAFWDGEASIYGDGNCNYGPSTTLEVVGHEFTHGMIGYTSKLVYVTEPGAINESLADMFGKMLEHKTDPANFSWVFGHSFLIGQNAEPFRVMDNPNSIEMPAYYKGLFWDDMNDIHTNSSIGNLWFSMLVDGRQGINEAGTAFNVPGLGMGKAGQIIFQVNRNYLTENSNYNSFYQYSVEVAENLYGAASLEAAAVREAWKAVGVQGVISTALDLEISGADFLFNEFCDPGQYVPLKFKIRNSSAVAYDPAMMGTVTLSNFNLPDYTINLSSPIGSGEVFEIEVNDWLDATNFGFMPVDASLNLADENTDNNSISMYYNIVEFEADELSLSVEMEDRLCFDTVLSVGMFVTNNSCEAVPSGTVLNFTAADNQGNNIWTSPPYALADDLPGNSSVYAGFEIPFTNVALVFTLVYPNDPDPLNNEFNIFKPSFLPITGNYMNKFQLNNGMDGYVQLNSQSGFTMPYQISKFFASTGRIENTDDFQRCPGALSVFNYENPYGIFGSIHACVDFSFSAAPTLEFDLAMFRNAFSDASNDLYSSMFQAKWQGNESGDQIIFGQPEGIVSHHNISLPPFFKGALALRLYTELGHGDLNPDFLDLDDYVLLDNLKLSAPTTGTEEVSKNSVILISPNPAREITNIRAPDGIKTILLQNVNGQTLQTFQVDATSYDLNLKGLVDGFYLLNIQFEDGQWAVRKLVKMD